MFIWMVHSSLVLLYSHCDTEKLETVRWENSRPLAEVQVALSHLAGKYKLDWERGSLVESCYYSQFLNSKHKIVLELV